MIWDNSITYKILGLDYIRNSINDKIDFKKHNGWLKIKNIFCVKL